MSKDSDKAEPSMDDILASIRRIIDEDGSKSRKPVPGPGGKPPADILELTEMVNDDGSVTSLERADAASRSSKPIDDDEPPIYADRDERDRPTVFGSPDSGRPNLAGDPRPTNMPQSAVEPPARAAPVPPPRPTTPPPAPPQAPPMQSQPPRITPTPSMGGSPISLTPVNQPQSGLVSGQAASAASAAFDRLAQAALQQQPPSPPPAPKAPSPTVGGRALEDMVGEMLRPMLQHWLDTNLPSIVERLVQQEIQKMSKR